ncbi:MAG: mandelate racemase/muconate lactonizing enzyme family protein [Rubrivivax sp.]|nr:mandelate racemase/muconate lactonizing enzyme family protein [Rubrivivax sp.]
MHQKIESIKTYVEGHWLFVAVTTDTGITGFGESTYFVSPLAAQQIVRELTPSLIGEDPMRAEYLFQRALKHHCIRDMASMGALSAIDQALWDIKGKALGVPVWELLGGRVRDRVRAILLIEASTEETIIQGALQAAAEGFTAIKIKPFVGGWAQFTRARLLRRTVDTVRAVRNAIGWDVDLAVEIHRNLLPDDAIEFSALLRDQSLYFLEDPILPFGVDANRWVAERMHGPVALAERNTSIWEFREYSDSQGVAILRPDIGAVGGFSQMRKITAIAESRHQRIVPHNFTSPVVTACHIQMAACTVNWDVQGYVREARSPWKDVVRHVNTLEAGYLRIPETPGIGMTLDLDFLATATHRPFGNAFAHGAPHGADGALKHQ